MVISVPCPRGISQYSIFPNNISATIPEYCGNGAVFLIRHRLLRQTAGLLGSQTSRASEGSREQNKHSVRHRVARSELRWWTTTRRSEVLRDL